MIKYSKEKFEQLKAAYLQHIEKTCEDPSAFIADQMRRFGPVSPSTKRSGSQCPRMDSPASRRPAGQPPNSKKVAVEELCRP